MEIKNLEENLEKLTGNDFEAAQKRFKMVNKDFVGVFQLEPGFQLEIAALALGCNVHDIKDLPLKKYNQVLKIVSRFLFNSDEEEIVAE